MRALGRCFVEFCMNFSYTAAGTCAMFSGRRIWVLLRLDTSLDDVEGTCDDTRHSTCCRSRQDLQSEPDISMSNPVFGVFLFLLVKCELQCRER